MEEHTTLSSLSNGEVFNEKLCNGCAVILDKSGYPRLTLYSHTDHDNNTTSIHRNTSGGLHCHTFCHPDNRVDRAARRKLVAAVILSVFFISGELVGGVLANSLAIATDAAHLTTDFLGYIINLIALHVSVRPRNKWLNFGWYRTQVLGAFMSILFIWTVTVVLAYIAGLRVRAVDFDINPKIMLIMATLGLVFNIIMLVSLHTDPFKNRDPGESVEEEKYLLSSSYSSMAGGQYMDKKHADSKNKNLSVLAATINVVGDLVQCMGVLVAAVIIYFKPEWKIADPVCTFLFCVIVLATTVFILRDIVNVLMEARPKGVDYEEVKKKLAAIMGVKSVHNLRMWSLTMDKAAAMVHLAVDSLADDQHIQVEAWQLLQENYQVIECTVQVERFTEDMLHCVQCREPYLS